MEDTARSIRERVSTTWLGEALIPDYPHGPRRELYGHDKWLLNFVVVVSLLTGVPPRELCADDAVLVAISERVGPGGFHFGIPRRLIDDWVAKHRECTEVIAVTQLYEAILYASEEWTGRLRNLTFNESLRLSSEASTLALRSVLRGQSAWTPPDVSDNTAATYWFLTCSLHDLRNVADIRDELSRRTVYLRYAFIGRCRQMVEHYHGVLETTVSVTQHYLSTALSGMFAVEPLKQPVKAAVRYIQNQIVGEPIMIPDEGVLAHFLDAPNTFQAVYFGKTKLDSRVAAMRAVREGTPWYVIKGVLNVRGKVRRRELRKLSRRHIHLKVKTWTSLLHRVGPEELDGVIRAISRDFGNNSTYFYRVDMQERWSGQPVIFLDGYDLYDHARSWLRTCRPCITHCIIVDEGHKVGDS
jgi:hypothetical protein